MTQVVAVGRASSRASGIAAPHTAHTPYVPAARRSLSLGELDEVTLGLPDQRLDL